MKKTSLMLIALSAMSIFSAAQQVNVEWGAPFDSETFISRIIGKDAKSHYAIASRKDALYFERYSSAGDMRQEVSKKIELPKYKGKEQDFEALYQLNSNFLLFTSYYDNDADQFTTTAYPVSRDGVINSAKAVEVFSVEANKKNERGDFNFVLSPDKSKLLVYHNVSLRKKNVLKSVFKVYTDKLDLLNDGAEEIALKDDDKGRNAFSNYTLTNEGAVFMLLEKVAPPDYVKQFTIWAYLQKGGSKKELPIEINNKKAYSMVFTPNESGDLLVSGFYVEKNKKGIFSYEGLAGIFYTRINISSGKIIAENTMAFDRETRALYNNEKQLEKGGMLPADFRPRQIVFDDKGGMIFVAEQYSVSYSQGQGRSTTVYSYGNIMLTSITPEGKISWVKIIRKSQVYVDTRMAIGLGGASIAASVWIPTSSDKTIFLSYLLTVKEGKIHIVYNEDARTAVLTDPNTPGFLKNVNKAIPVHYVVDGSSGNMTRATLLEAKDHDVILRPGITYEVEPGTVIIYGSKKEKDKFGIMKF